MRVWQAAVIGAAFALVTGCGDSTEDGGSEEGGGGVEPGPAERFLYEVLALDQAATPPTVTFRVVDPTNGNRPYDIDADAPFTAQGAGLTMFLAWPSNEYTNDGVGTGLGQPKRIALLTANPPRNADGSYTLSLTGPNAVTLPTTGTITVELEGHPVVDGENVPVTTEVEYFGAGTSAAEPRRVVVDTQKCNTCHAGLHGLPWLSAHGENRNNNVQACVICHNPSATDKARADAAAGGPKDDTSIDMKWMIHVIHAQGMRREPVTIYGFGNPPAAHQFPAISNMACVTCHTNETQRTRERPDGVSVEAWDTTVDANAYAVIADNVRIPGMVAACTSCHDKVCFTNSALTPCVAGDRNPAAGCYHPVGLPLSGSCTGCHDNVHQ